MRWAFVALLLVGVVPDALCAAPYEVAGVKLDVTAAPEKMEFMVGEPGYVLFKIANLSDRNVRIMVGGDYRNRLGRPDSFQSTSSAPRATCPSPTRGCKWGASPMHRNSRRRANTSFVCSCRIGPRSRRQAGTP